MAGRRRSARQKQNREQNTFDYSLLLITLCLVGFGLLMIYSASSYTSQVKYNDSTYFLKKQAIGVVAGLVAMFIVCKIPYKYYAARLPLLRLRMITLVYMVAVVMHDGSCARMDDKLCVRASSAVTRMDKNVSGTVCRSRVDVCEGECYDPVGNCKGVMEKGE